ncbi:hypothetical protein Pelo_13956 [Pelomyxa schiedti]|nr:hypothetical protein Pelo_13956 [Pelomyxa schiedti]
MEAGLGIDDGGWVSWFWGSSEGPASFREVMNTPLSTDSVLSWLAVFWMILTQLGAALFAAYWLAIAAAEFAAVLSPRRAYSIFAPLKRVTVICALAALSVWSWMSWSRGLLPKSLVLTSLTIAPLIVFMFFTG